MPNESDASPGEALAPVQPTSVGLPAEWQAPPRTLWERVNPLEPERWRLIRERGRGSFIVRYGIPFVGVPGAAIMDFLMALRHAVRWHHAFSFHIGVPGLGFSLLIGSVVGYAGGKWLWERGERRLKDEEIKEAFKRAPPEWGRAG